MAIAPVAADLPLAVVDGTKGVLIVPCVGGDEIYSMTDPPSPTASLVEAQKKEILTRLELKTVLTNLHRASDLLFLAFMATWGTGELNVSVATRQTRLLDLCGYCEVTMDALKKASTRVRSELLEAFEYLLEANEKQAIEHLSSCAEHAKTMSAKCQKLAEDFGTLKDETVTDKLTAIEKLGDENVKLAELERDQRGMEAKRSSEAAEVKETIRIIEELEQKIIRAESKENRARGSKDVLQIVDILAGVGGLAAGVVFDTIDRMHPITIYKAILEKLHAGKIQDNGYSITQELFSQIEAAVNGTCLNIEQLLVLQVDIAAKLKEHVAEVELEEGKASDVKKAVAAQVLQANVDKTQKQTALDDAKSALDPEAAKVAQAKLDASAAELATLEEELRTAEDCLKEAQSRTKLVVERAEELTNSVAAKKFKEFTERRDKELKELTAERLQLVKLKIEKENQRRASLGELAFLTSSLESSRKQAKVGKSAKASLDIAQWALTNIEVSLYNAKVLWDNMQRFCEDLGTPEARQKIEDQINDQASQEERVEYYKSSRFVPIAVTYICKWTALISVCGEYAEASAQAQKAVGDHIRHSPNADEAIDLMKPLHTRLKAEHEAAMMESDTVKAALEATFKQLKIEAARPAANA